MAARDYKNAGSRRHERRGLPGWVWMLSGLAIGLFVALLVYLADQPEMKATRPSVSVNSGKQQDVRDVKKPQAKEEIPPPPKPRFDFYTLLPELEVVIPDGDYTVKEESPSTPQKPVEQPGSYILQAGSFKRYEEADRMKASLALLGVQASIQSVEVNRDTWHRVRIGPYQNLAQLNEIRGRLRENDIETLLVKAK